MRLQRRWRSSLSRSAVRRSTTARCRRWMSPRRAAPPPRKPCKPQKPRGRCVPPTYRPVPTGLRVPALSSTVALRLPRAGAAGTARAGASRSSKAATTRSGSAGRSPTTCHLRLPPRCEQQQPGATLRVHRCTQWNTAGLREKIGRTRGAELGTTA